MEIFKIDLYEYFGLKRQNDAKGYLTVYKNHDTDQYGIKIIRPATLVLGGGGYYWISERETEPVALAYMYHGYNAFTLEYSTATVRYPAQLLEGCMAIAYIKENAERLLVDAERVAVVGFSAGGHLAGSLATLYGEDIIKKSLGKKAELCRPDAVVLSYPVITSGKYTHLDSMECLLGGDKENLEKVSLEKRVTKTSSPAFVWATVDDDCVPVENSLLYATACKKAGVPFELHIFEHGPHGLSLATKEVSHFNGDTEIDNPHLAKWFTLSIEWLKSRGFELNLVKR